MKPEGSASMAARFPPDALCERCYSPVLRSERAVRLGHIVGSTLRGDLMWSYTFLHPYDSIAGCVREPRTGG